MAVLRVTFLFLLALTLSPLPACAFPSILTGENCHAEAQGTAEASVDPAVSAAPEHDTSCGCELHRPSRPQVERQPVPALLPLPNLLLSVRLIRGGFIPPVAAAPPPVMLAVSLPLLN